MSPLAREKLLDGLRRNSRESLSAIARRSYTVLVAKKLLPAAGILLLVALVAIPSLHAGMNRDRVTYHISSATTAAPSRMSGAQYHGTDQQGQPFTVTATTADQQDEDHIALASPEGDITMKSGAWMMLRSDTGMYHQKSQLLHLSGNVTLYRNDGTILTVPVAAIDLHEGSANSSAPVQVQGPFGTLNAQNGFSLTNRGTDIMFNGPATLVLAQTQ
jgi:lipopolysaccharide export system protein LptC